MSPTIKEEALEQLKLDIAFGFDNEEQIFDSIRDMFYEEEDFDEDWLRQVIAEQYNKHQQESLQWKRPTDFDRLAKAFDELIAQEIVCLHKAGYTKQDGEGDCMETVEQLRQMGIYPIGYCYYHTQDLGRVVDAGNRGLYIGFDSVTQNDEQALAIANKIVRQLSANGFEVNWPGTVDERIEIVNIDWKKVPGNEDWGAERVIRLMAKPGKKSFWKFW